MVWGRGRQPRGVGRGWVRRPFARTPARAQDVSEDCSFGPAPPFHQVAVTLANTHDPPSLVHLGLAPFLRPLGCWRPLSAHRPVYSPVCDIAHYPFLLACYGRAVHDQTAGPRYGHTRRCFARYVLGAPAPCRRLVRSVCLPGGRRCRAAAVRSARHVSGQVRWWGRVRFAAGREAGGGSWRVLKSYGAHGCRRTILTL